MSIILLSSCSHEPESLKVIPKETNAVSIIDIHSIVKKGKLDEITEFKFFRTLKKEIRNENKKVSRIMDNIIENPSVTGVNFSNDLFLYYLNQADDEKYFCISAEIKNKEKFGTFLEETLDEMHVEFGMEKNKDYNHILLGEAVIGWDADKLIILLAENYRSRTNLDLEIETLMKLKEKDQITSNKEFNKFYENKKDLSAWFSTNMLEDSYGFRKIQKSVDFDLSENHISAHLNFGDNNISLVTTFSPNEEIQKMISKNDVWSSSFNKKLLKYFPEKNYAAASVSMNPMAYYNILEKEDGFSSMQSAFEEDTEVNLKELIKSIEGNALYSLLGFENIEYTYKGWGYSFNEDEATLLDERYEISKAGDLSDDDKEQLNQGKTIKVDNYSGKYCINIKNVLDNGETVESAISKNLKVNWYEGGWDFGRNIETTREEYLPIMSMAFDINGSKVIKKLMDKIPEKDLTKRNNYYEFSIDNRYPAYLAYNEKILLLTNDKKSIEAFKKGGYSSNSLSSSNISSNISNSQLYMYLNLNYEEYPTEIKKEIRNNQNSQEKKMFSIWNDFARSIELRLVDKNSVEIVFNTKKGGTNSLNTIITLLDANYKYFMSM